jgi:hypothetical protein
MRTSDVMHGWLAWATGALPLASSWQGLFFVLAFPLISWAREATRAFQECQKIKMVLKTGKPGSLVATRRKKRQFESTVIVLVGSGDMAEARKLLERWNG